MTHLFGPDNWSAGVALLARNLSPAVSATAVYERLGIGALYVMSEEWWDLSIVEMHPRMPVGFIPELYNLRQQQLQRLSSLGMEMRLDWHRADDPLLWQSIESALSAGQSVGVFGVVGASPVFVQSIVGSLITGRDMTGGAITIDLTQMRAPAGIGCLTARPASMTATQFDDDLPWLVHLLAGLPTIAFDTPRHPLRDWQVWHIGADAFAVAALSAETAAPLAIVSDNVTRIIHAYMWRVDILQQQLVRINAMRYSNLLRDAIDACHDVRFFLNVVAQQYPLTVARRALTLPEGALIAETCRDTRQVLKDIVELLHGAY